MIRELALVSCFVLFLASATRAVLVQGGTGGQTQPRDCSLVGGSCTNPTAACRVAGGGCASGGTNGENGFFDPDGDGCGCQI